MKNKWQLKTDFEFYMETSAVDSVICHLACMYPGTGWMIYEKKKFTVLQGGYTKAQSWTMLVWICICVH